MFLTRCYRRHKWIVTFRKKKIPVAASFENSFLNMTWTSTNLLVSHPRPVKYIKWHLKNKQKIKFPHCAAQSFPVWRTSTLSSSRKDEEEESLRKPFLFVFLKLAVFRRRSKFRAAESVFAASVSLWLLTTRLFASICCCFWKEKWLSCEGKAWGSGLLSGGGATEADCLCFLWGLLMMFNA